MSHQQTCAGELFIHLFDAQTQKAPCPPPPLDSGYATVQQLDAKHLMHIITSTGVYFFIKGNKFIVFSGIAYQVGVL